MYTLATSGGKIARNRRESQGNDFGLMPLDHYLSQVLGAVPFGPMARIAEFVVGLAIT